MNRAFGKLLLCSLMLALLAGASGCAEEQAGIDPSRDTFYFPVGLAIDPDRQVLYVANSNADLRYNGGTLMALDIGLLPQDLTQVGAAVQSGKLGCEPDRIDATRWECAESPFIIPSSVLRIGHFPNGMALSPSRDRLFLPIRGEDPADHLLWVDVVPLTSGGKVDLRCDSECSGSTDCPSFDCDAEHRVGYSQRIGQSLPKEPFAVLVDRQPNGEDWVFVTHLAGGEVSFFSSSPTPGGPVELQDFRSGFFDTNSTVVGGFALAARLPGDATNNPIYVSSRSDSVLASFVVRGGERIIRTERLAMRGASPGDDVRGIGFSPDGMTLFAISRRPASLVAIDLSEEDGQPRREALWAVEVCSEPSVLQLRRKESSSDPNAMLAYVVCFGEGAIYVVDTELAKLVGRIDTGAGPNHMVIDASRQRAFIANFIENTIGVIDLDPTHPSFRRMMLRIGRRKNLIKD